MPSYTWLTFAQAKTALAARLMDPGKVFFVDQELGMYLIEGLRAWNALTCQFNVSLSFSTPANTWVDLSSLGGSPRQRTVLDSELYTLMQYHLLEPPTGGTWTGSTQFAITDLSGALQRRRDEIIQETACRLAVQPLTYTLGNPRTFFPDSTLEARRARWVPDSGLPVTLSREDRQSFNWFSPATATIPSAYDVIDNPPLALDVDFPAAVTGKYDTLVIQSGPDLNPPTASFVGIPDDWAWLAKYGAMADLFSRDIESADPLRAGYCLNRYEQGMKVMRACAWLLTATVNGNVVDTPAVGDMDSYDCEWDSRATANTALVVGGVDMVRVSPFSVSSAAVVVNLVGNIAVPSADGDFVQVSRDVFDVILDYAEHISSLKRGGAEFAATKPLHDNFMKLAVQTNKRLELLGIFRDVLKREGHLQEERERRMDI